MSRKIIYSIVGAIVVPVIIMTLVIKGINYAGVFETADCAASELCDKIGLISWELFFFWPGTVVIGGALGGILGFKLSKKIDRQETEKLADKSVPPSPPLK